MPAIRNLLNDGSVQIGSAAVREVSRIV